MIEILLLNAHYLPDMLILNVQDLSAVLAKVVANIDAMLASVAAIVAGVVTFRQRNLNTEVKGTRVDIAQILQQQVETNDIQQSEIMELQAGIKGLIQFTKTKEDREKFRRKVLNVGDASVRSMANVNREKISIMLKASRKAADFLIDTGENLNRDWRLIETEAYGVAFLLSQNENFSDRAAKNFVAKIELLSLGQYNGRTQTEYEKIGLAWVSELLEKGVELIK